MNQANNGEFGPFFSQLYQSARLHKVRNRVEIQMKEEAMYNGPRTRGMKTIIDRKICSGRFSNIHLAHRDKKKCIVKYTYRQKVDDHDLYEYRVLKHLQEHGGKDHGVVGVTGYVENYHTIGIVMEYCDRTFESRWKDSRIEPTQARAILHPLLSAIKFLKDHGVAHRHIRPSNVMYQYQKNGKKITQVLKLVGFGRATLNNEVKKLPHAKYRFDYAAPEDVLKLGGNIGHATDVLSVGLLVLSLFQSRRVRNPLITGRHSFVWQWVKFLGYPPNAMINAYEDVYFNKDSGKWRFVNPANSTEDEVEATWEFPFARIDDTVCTAFQVTGYDKKCEVDFQELKKLFKKMIKWDPMERVTAEEALNSRFFSRAFIQNLDGLDKDRTYFSRNEKYLH